MEKSRKSRSLIGRFSICSVSNRVGLLRLFGFQSRHVLLHQHFLLKSGRLQRHFKIQALTNRQLDRPAGVDGKARRVDSQFIRTGRQSEKPVIAGCVGEACRSTPVSMFVIVTAAFREHTPAARIDDPPSNVAGRHLRLREAEGTDEENGQNKLSICDSYLYPQKDSAEPARASAPQFSPQVQVLARGKRPVCPTTAAKGAH